MREGILVADKQLHKVFPSLSNEELEWAIDRSNPKNPFSNFVGNDKAVYRLSRAAFIALKKEDHCAGQQNFALVGPASVGKTTLAKNFAQLLDIPFVEIEPMTIKAPLDILLKIAKICQNTIINLDNDQKTSLELIPDESKKLLLPPMVVFIDEIHNLKNDLVQALLKATEKNDGIFDTGNIIANCCNVCWIIATTERGLLFDAFDTRFTKINVEMYSMDDIAIMIWNKHKEWPWDLCELIAKYGGRIPREAFAFLSEVELEKEMHNGNWEDIAKQVAVENGIDPIYGMTNQRVLILTAIAEQGSIAKARLGNVIGVKVEEIEKFIMPPLIMSSEDQPQPLVGVGSRGYILTEAGFSELDRRGIKYNKK